MDVAGLRHDMDILMTVFDAYQPAEGASCRLCHDTGFLLGIADGTGEHFQLTWALILQRIADVDLRGRDELTYAAHDAVDKVIVNRQINLYAPMINE